MNFIFGAQSDFFNTFTDGGIFGPFQQLLRAANSGVLSASNYGAVTLGANPNLPVGGYSHLRVDTVKETHCDALSAGLKVTTMKIAWLQIWKTTHFSSNFLRQCVDTLSPALSVFLFCHSKSMYVMQCLSSDVSSC